MMRKLLLNLVVLLSLFGAASVTAAAADGIPYYRKVYPDVEQSLLGTEIFQGDRHGQFEGDFLARLSDGSAWKIHPDNRAIYANWSEGDIVRVKVRTEFYWLKREHKFWLYNQTRGESAKAMLIKHKDSPSLKIVSTDSYAKSTGLVAVPTLVLDPKTGQTVTVISHQIQPTNFRKILGLSDGTFWVIKEEGKFNSFALGTPVFVGAQGSQTNFYDFVFIVGDQREAAWTYARPHK